MEKIKFEELDELVNSHVETSSIVNDMKSGAIEKIELVHSFSAYDKKAKWVPMSDHELKNYILPMLEDRKRRVEKILDSHKIKL